MSQEPPSNAITPARQGSSAFSQQGSLDWIALGNTQYSASIAILGRLAKAGIDTLTVAFGQAMCANLPIGSHGEKVLAEAMSKLTAKSSAGDLIWFGVGVRHILRELVQTSQGCSLVALCAALTEGLPISVSALVLYEAARQFGGSRELSPSLEQWEALVRVAAPVLNSTTFGLRVGQIAKSAAGSSFRIVHHPPHPTDLAKILYSTAELVKGSLANVTIEGGLFCGWVSAWCDYVLGLRVLVRDSDGNIVYANFDSRKMPAQVNVSFSSSDKSSSLMCTGNSHWISSGKDFVEQCFKKGQSDIGRSIDCCFFVGRLQWESMLEDTFGDNFSRLMKRPHRSFPATSFLELKQRMSLRGKDLRPDEVFPRLLAIGVMTITDQSIALERQQNASQYFLRACNTLPELWQCQSQVDMWIRELSTIDEKQLMAAYRVAGAQLCQSCQCSKHKHTSFPESYYCLFHLANAIIYLIFLLDRTVLDTAMNPTAYGLHSVYHIAENSGMLVYCSSVEHDERKTEMDFRTFFKSLTQNLELAITVAFHPIATLFSAVHWEYQYHEIIAKSDGKLYCYVEIVEAMTDDLRAASRVHVGSGSIEYGTRHYSTIYDMTEELDAQPAYPARSTRVVEGLGSLNLDTTSPHVEVKAIVQEKPTSLHFGFCVTSNGVHMFIALQEMLCRLMISLLWKVDVKSAASNQIDWATQLQGQTFILVEGEGLVDTSTTCHSIRPLRGNTIGRCIAVVKSEGNVALVKTVQDLNAFFEYWTLRWAHHGTRPHPNSFFCLIS